MTTKGPTTMNQDEIFKKIDEMDTEQKLLFASMMIGQAKKDKAPHLFKIVRGVLSRASAELDLYMAEKNIR